jgi:hypothetical protein
VWDPVTPVLINLFAAISISFSLLLFLFTTSAYLVLFLGPGKSLAASVTSVTVCCALTLYYALKDAMAWADPGEFAPGKDNA